MHSSKAEAGDTEKLIHSTLSALSKPTGPKGDLHGALLSSGEACTDLPAAHCQLESNACVWNRNPRGAGSLHAKQEGSW